MPMRTICIVATNRSDYGRLKPVMDALRTRDDVKLQIIIGSFAYFDNFFSYLRHANPVSFIRSLPWYIRARLTHLLGGDSAALRYERLAQVMAADGYAVDARLPLLVEGGTPSEMVSSAGFGLLGLPAIFKKLKPDIVLINGDRFEIISVAIAAAYMNIPLAHIEGGDVSGTIDNSTRHAISKLAHLHFPATSQSAGRLARMGEDPKTVFTFGSPIIDSLKEIDLHLDNSFYDRYPLEVGRIDLTKPYILISHHPVTTEYADNYRQMKELLAALDTVGLPQFFIAPNIDAGSDGITIAMREYRASDGIKRSVFHKHIALEEYIKLLAHAAVAVGNSSSFLREAAYLGTPAVLVGTRQLYRERGDNVREVATERNEIADAILVQLKHGPYTQDVRFGDGTAAKRIAEVLATYDLEKINVQKFFWENNI